MKQFTTIRFLSILAGLLFYTSFSNAQGTITVDHKTQRFIGNVSTLDRDKYLQAHFWFPNEDADFTQFKTDYLLNSEYLGSRRFWSPLGKVKNGVIPSVKEVYDGVRIPIPHVDTGHPNSLFHDSNVDYAEADISVYSKNVANYIAQNYKDEWSPLPTIFEPLNEPMVHANEYYPGNDKAKTDKVITKICEFIRDVGASVRAVPELENMQVAGYASAWPEFEKDDFDIWNTRYKKFIDIAGADVDIFSVHLYDGKGLNNSGGRRSGSNSEAILDMIEAYSFIKLGEVKPLAITEYGRLVDNQPNWAKGNGVSNYHPIENSQAVRSQIHMVMSFMERADHMVTTIPFSTGKGEPTEEYAKAGLWTRNSANQWELTPRKYFFEVWKNVKGKRVSINSTNVDVQSQAFVNGKQLYVVLNNLNDVTQTVDLNVLNTSDLNDVKIKRLKTFVDKEPEFTQTTVTQAPSSLSLEYGETIVLVYNFDLAITSDHTEFSKKYYASTYLQAITANTANSFTFNGIDRGNGSGNAILRVGVGRDLGKSLKPTVTVNGNDVNTDGDLIKGYDQNNRSRFFGVLEIPVNLSYLNAGNNTVSVKFSDGGGHISSVVLQVNTNDKPYVAPSNYFFIENRETGKYLRPKEDVEGSLMVQAPSSWKADFVQWQMIPVEGETNYFYLKNKETGRYIRPVSEVDGSALEAVDASNTWHMTQWEKVISTGEWFYLKNRWSGMYFRPSSYDDISADTGLDYEMVQRPSESYTGNYTQWRFAEVSSSARITAIEDQLNEHFSKVSVFPNPITGGNIHLALDKDIETKVSLFSIDGELLFHKTVKQKDLDISAKGYKSGVYILKSESQFGVKTIKLLID
ncbi:T9SS type A sorting domain-containing protein [Sediminitomix flava]|uniref:Putative secreted protein (Por secretion system target) n=1 Tax=Sediminitomix flava TaxID=379075 RepID=A0A315Z0I9_SEDFL|nr:T9SS type A sorting domain-containing protein [Sediminitomix flava]PWJ34981.1 putative secreted protein (Por secretion system target) [Sediminitomix flava]